jgi:HEAT repeat protein
MGKQMQTTAAVEALMDALVDKDGMLRQKARESLVGVGRPAVPPLIRALRRSKVDQLRWEAAKALGAIGDAAAGPALVKALEDKNQDVAWLAAEALRTLKKAAWPVLLRALARRGARSAVLRQGAHHVFWGQREEGFEDLIPVLVKALRSRTIPEMTPRAARDILRRMREQEASDRAAQRDRPRERKAR